ncbi:MAG: ATP-binding cassette domain-containing protein [Desulfarculales bacterium]|jgi:cell division transport system ATP-binding protein|nr:ATP-binding cassette domain-containing protein [Desulfarculales bacterium]
MIIFDKLSKRYHNKAGWALTDISVHISPGQFVFLTGPSGAGKSTMLRLIYGAELPSRGTLRVGGADLGRIKAGQIPRLRRNIGVVFQDFRLSAGGTVLENVALPLHVAGMRGKKLIAAAAEIMRRVNLLDKAQCRAGSMSGGEQQRVAVARALATGPPLLLADEPTGNLDPDNAREVMRLLLDAHQAGATVLVATHDPLLLGLVKGARCLHLTQGRFSMDETL